MRNTVSKHHGVKIEFFTTPRAPIVFGGTIGPTGRPLPTATPVGSSVVPAYQVTELVRATPPRTTKTGQPAKQTAKPPPTTPTTTANAGDSLLFSTVVSGAIQGAPQTVTLTIDQGPGSTVHASATVPGGQTSQATIKSADGSPIAIVLPRYACPLPPAPTFCPAMQTIAGFHRYTLKFAAAPTTPRITLYATVQKG
jgi:hypothetical protein